jgi:hypothetical protein
MGGTFRLSSSCAGKMSLFRVLLRPTFFATGMTLHSSAGKKYYNTKENNTVSRVNRFPSEQS